jgi:hypothetical protein
MQYWRRGGSEQPRAERLARTCLAVIPLAVCAAACGASINAVYEGDVRFEHCMALDSGKNVKPTIRRACWEEWIRFYTFGQTRDRVDYAKVRVQKLSGASDFDEGDWVPADKRPSAAPEPTSVLAPPPMTLAIDAGPPPDVPAPVPSTSAPMALPGAACAERCEPSFSLCSRECKTPACEKTCATKYRLCMRKCF